jgi:flagellar FliL protein
MSGAPDAPAPEKPKGGGKWMMMVAAGVALLIGGGVGAGGMFFLGGSAAHAEAPADGEHAEAGEEPAEGGGHGAPEAEEGGGGGGGHGASAPDKPALPMLRGNRSVVSLGTFTVNLRGSGGGRVLRAEVQVEVAAREAEAVDTYKPVLRDAVITLASDFTYADLEGVDGKTHLRDELLGRLNTVLEGKPTVDRLYFTEFVVQ